jgi:hypothetical protein
MIFVHRIQGLIRVKTLLAAAVAVGVLAVAAPASAAPASPAAYCNSSVTVCGCTDNVKIRSGPGTGYAAVGLCARDLLVIHETGFGDSPPGCNDLVWDRSTDRRTGVTGWISGCYIAEFA